MLTYPRPRFLPAKRTPMGQEVSLYIVTLKLKRTQTVYYLVDTQLNISSSKLDAMIFAEYSLASFFANKVEARYKTFFYNTEASGHTEAVHHYNML
ncbi:hypothetical protein NKT34_08385 [Paenibacillus polysaccharolyticus]|uniref:hypothetical protein n=1 Tax=Paenibacillus polysaccharolyticus TaxID=582692 RepID=UPI00209FF073|nr:hypothetical protein [Paenibacillus polysaccharolyticus]MCP1133304.1 hypothetical protein [Paenibacillus polysaccharolyticus]